GLNSPFLYGAKLHYNGPGLMYTARKNSLELEGKPAEVTVFGASALQQSAHAEFLATGGSLYYLKHKHVIEGSEKVMVQVRDKITNLVLSSEMKSEGVDYDIDYSNGRIIFYKPIHSVSDSGSIISTNILDGNPVYVMVDYEYEVPEYHFREGSYGGRVTQELPEWQDIGLTIGGSFVREQKDNTDYTLIGADSVMKIADLGEITAEYAQSETQAVNNFVSTDGGLNFNTIAHPSDEKGQAYSFKGKTRPIITGTPGLG
ncbi:unnamed protein product, partial [marine sediment metagenome]